MNLETQLLKENKRLFSESQLLQIQEYERYSELAEDDVLFRAGLNQSILSGKKLKENSDATERDLSKFDRGRVFHITQIKSICNKYYLRFLDTCYYNGVIDKNVSVKISTFETAYGVECDDRLKIMAPPGSFKLEKKPKDPLLFYRITDEWYYLIYKWGNDLSWFRRLLPFFSKVWFCALFTNVLFFLIMSGIYLLTKKEGIPIIWFFTTLLFNLIFGGLDLSTEFDDSFGRLRFIKRNKWNSKYL